MDEGAKGPNSVEVPIDGERPRKSVEVTVSICTEPEDSAF